MTPAYAPPEFRKGLPADHRTDVYGCGLVLYQLLTGSDPDRARTSPPSTLQNDLDPTWDTVIAKAIKKNPDKRFQTVDEMASAVRALL